MPGTADQPKRISRRTMVRAPNLPHNGGAAGAVSETAM
jgi:hypothetical protein